MFWVFDEVKRGIYKRTAVLQECENHSKGGANIELPLSDTLEIKGIKLYMLVGFAPEENLFSLLLSY